MGVIRCLFGDVLDTDGMESDSPSCADARLDMSQALGIPSVCFAHVASTREGDVEVSGEKVLVKREAFECDRVHSGSDPASHARYLRRRELRFR